MRYVDEIRARKIRSGDIASFEGLVEEYKSRIFSYCLRMSAQPSDAEELAQDVFVQVYRCIGQYDASRGSLSTWIYHIAHNACANYWRARPPDSVDLDSARGVSLEHDPYPRWDERQRLIEALNRLNPGERELVLMKDYLNLKEQNIAVILDIPAGTVKSRLHSARRKLREYLKEGD